MEESTPHGRGGWDALPYDATGARPLDTESVGANGFLTTPTAVGTPRHDGSRWAGDSITLNRWSRVAATIALLLPIVWMVFFAGVAAFLFLGMYVIVVLPMALRDVWRRTQITLPPPQLPKS